MPLSPEPHRNGQSTGRDAARLESVLAVGRAFLTVTGFIAIYLDPTEPARLAEVTYAVLFGYAVYSLAVLAYVHGAARLTPWHARLLHGLDILWTSVLTFVSEGPVSPFFLFFLFAVLAAAYRWGFRETFGTAVVTAGVVLAETAIAAAGPWHPTAFDSMTFELNSAILRLSYLLLTGVLLGYLAEAQKHARSELGALADAARHQHGSLGVGGSVTALAGTMLQTFRAAAASIVIRDHEANRTAIWHVDPSADRAAAPRVRRFDLDRQQQASWLFADPGRAWHAVIAGAGQANARVTEPGVWRLRRDSVALPEAVRPDGPFRTVTALNLGLADEWQARVYLFDVADRRGVERRLHFLESLAEYMTPALTNVFLLRRLRARAGASERARVARELHDGAIQALFGIELKLEAMRRETPRTSDEVNRELGEIQQLLRSEVLALRELMQALRPIELDSAEQLPDVLAALVERFRRDTGISARFASTGGRIPVSPARALEIVRIVQEALVNVRKHSRARNVLVRLTSQNGACRLLIEDDGEGFGFEGRLTARELDDRRVGPAIIKERARLAAADLVVDSTPGAGTRIEIDFNEELHA